MKSGKSLNLINPDSDDLDKQDRAKESKAKGKLIRK